MRLIRLRFASEPTDILCLNNAHESGSENVSRWVVGYNASIQTAGIALLPLHV